MIKKVFMFVDVDDKLLEDDFSKKEYEEYLKESTPEEAASQVVEDYLNLVVQDCFTDFDHINNHSYTVDDVEDEDKESYEYLKLLKDE